jgi:dTDP-4-amino-4,6-dideoxygalactose transaminase
MQPSELRLLQEKLGPHVPIARPALPEFARYVGLLREVYHSRRLSNFAKFSQLLEERAAPALDHPAPLCVSSCDVGMVLAWRALGCRQGEVITPSFTLSSTVNALRWNGLEPVFADIDPRTLCLDPEDVRRRIGPRTVGIAAVHVFGRPAPVTELEELASTHGLRLLFDAAHGIGARYQGRGLGACGDAAVFSLSGTKVVTAGEGGLATFRCPEAADRFRRLRGYGFLGDYNCEDVGLNGKLSEMNAALGYLSLELLESAVRRRRALACYYREQLRDVPGLRFQKAARGDRHAYKDFALLFERSEQRAAAEQALRVAGVETKRYFLPVHRMTAYAAYANIRLPITDDCYERVLCLPFYHELRKVQVRQVCAIIRDVLSRSETSHGLA